MPDTKYSPLVSEEENVGFVEKPSSPRTVAGARKRLNFSWLQAITTGSLILNAYAMFRTLNVVTHTTPNLNIPVSRYANLAYNKLVSNTYYSEYWSTNDTQPLALDELWESIDTNPVMVTLSQEYVLEHQLPPSTAFPWDETRGLYFIQGYHLLHCLKNIRRTLISYERTGHGGPMEHHLHHCLDSIRQYLTCHADDTPLAAGLIDKTIGQDQLVQCRDMEDLRKWAQDDRHRNPCWRSLDDYREVAHELERYAFCPPDSPYKAAADAYFAEHGHQDIFVDDEGK